MKELVVVRHADADGDVLTPDGVVAARVLGQHLDGPFALVATSGAHRAMQTAACVLATGRFDVEEGVAVVPRLRSEREDDWRALYKKAGSGHLAQLRRADEDFVERESRRLCAGLHDVCDRLLDGQRALVVGHSPTNEAAVYGLTGHIVEPLGKCEGVVVRVDRGGHDVERLR